MDILIHGDTQIIQLVKEFPCENQIENDVNYKEQYEQILNLIKVSNEGG